MALSSAPWRTEPKSKIVCTIGPASQSEEQLRALLEAGADVLRLNFSHGTQEEHAQVITRARRIAEQLNVPVAILQDLAGPKVRIGTFTNGSITLRAGESFTLTTRPIVGTQQVVSVSYAHLPQEVKPGLSFSQMEQLPSKYGRSLQRIFTAKSL